MKEQEAAAVAKEDVVEIETWNPEESLRPFLNEALLVNEEISAIHALLKVANNDSKLAHKQDLRLALRDRINSQISEILNAARRICKRLEVIDRANAENCHIFGCGERTAVDRARISVTNWLRRCPKS
ncbi:syntaxin-121-like [Phalaenopsis equestris]|uniref:syntaxin-121-like n=1 Tax=Phalaenopsis equestris TaxID=78828 RepID=UPI0009E195FA|nr:syntaxin-121-like [Phalaenopsis equestris]